MASISAEAWCDAATGVERQAYRCRQASAPGYGNVVCTIAKGIKYTRPFKRSRCLQVLPAVLQNVALCQQGVARAAGEASPAPKMEGVMHAVLWSSSVL